jgi:hypothetical protein
LRRTSQQVVATILVVLAVLGTIWVFQAATSEHNWESKGAVRKSPSAPTE